MKNSPKDEGNSGWGFPLCTSVHGTIGVIVLPPALRYHSDKTNSWFPTWLSLVGSAGRKLEVPKKCPSDMRSLGEPDVERSFSLRQLSRREWNARKSKFVKVLSTLSQI